MPSANLLDTVALVVSRRFFLATADPHRSMMARLCVASAQRLHRACKQQLWPTLSPAYPPCSYQPTAIDAITSHDACADVSAAIACLSSLCYCMACTHPPVVISLCRLHQPASPTPVAPAATAPVAQEQHWPTLGDSKEVPKKKKGTSTPPEQPAASAGSSKVSTRGDTPAGRQAALLDAVLISAVGCRISRGGC